MNPPRPKRQVMNRFLILLVTMILTSGGALGAEHNCCAECGCSAGLRTVCRWVCVEVEEQVPGWDCKCEQIAIPGKSTHCIEPDCDCAAVGSQSCTKHPSGCDGTTKMWGPPGNCRVKTVKLLVRTEKTITKNVWKPVIETVCSACCSQSTVRPWPDSTKAKSALETQHITHESTARQKDNRAHRWPATPGTAVRASHSGLCLRWPALRPPTQAQ